MRMTRVLREDIRSGGLSCQPMPHVGVLSGVALVVALASCTGRIGDGVPLEKKAIAGTLVPQEAPACVEFDPGPSPMRRLTSTEYDNTVRDLLGDNSAPASKWLADGVALGFDNNADAQATTPFQIKQMSDTAEIVAANAVGHLDDVLPCDPKVDGEGACGNAFVESFTRKAYRRPLTPDDTKPLADLFEWGLANRDFDTAIRLVIEAILQHPDFLYRVEVGAESPEDHPDLVRLTNHEVAARLSYLLWNSTPDDELLLRADAGELRTYEQIRAEAERMIDDAKARDAVRNFGRQWLALDMLDLTAKDADLYPDFDTDVRDSMRQGSLTFIEHVTLDSDKGDFDELFTADYAFVNTDTAPYFGVPTPGSDEFEKVAMNPAERAGIVTDLAVLAANAKPDQSSPVARGVFVRERLLCQTLPSPPDDVDISIPELDPNLTTRERFAIHTSNPSCAGCHVLIDGIGFGFESYDAVGAFRKTENGLPIDATGEIVATVDANGPFDGAIELAKILSQSEEVRSCVVTQWFRFASGRGEGSYDACTLEVLGNAFATGKYRLRDLVIALTQTPGFLYRRPVPTDTKGCAE